MAEVIGAVAAAASLGKIVATVLYKFGTPQNAPREVKRLKGILEDLNDRHLLDSASEPDKERLKDLISEAEETLKKHLKKPNPFLQFFWPEDAEEHLRKVNNGLHDDLVRIGMKVDREHRFSLASPTAPTPSSSTTTSAARPARQTHKPSSPSQARRPTFDLPLPASASERKKGHKLPATLYLQDPDGKNAVGPLEVKYLRVLERDESTRYIHYERKTPNNNLEVTHRIPRSCLRFEDDKLNEKQVNFLDPHRITVVRSGKGHEVFFLLAKYEFNSPEHREDFIARMLERELLGRFYAEEILYKGLLQAQGTVVRLWRKAQDADPTSPGCSKEDRKTVMKLTYLAGGEKWEGDLKSFEKWVDVDETAGRVTLVEADQGAEKPTTMVIKFKSPPRVRKQSTPVPTTPGTRTPKKRERTLSSQTTIIPGPEDKETLSPTKASQQPEPKRSTWSLRRFSRTSVTSVGKETLSPDMGMTSPDSTGHSTGPSSAVSSPAMSHVSKMTDDHNNSSRETTSSSGASTNTTGPSSEALRPDAERFLEIWKTYHPLNIPHLQSLPPILTTTPTDMGGWGGLDFGSKDGGDYTVITGNSRSAARSPSTSPRASPLPASLSGGASSGGRLEQDNGTAKETGMGIQPRLEGLYPRDIFKF